MDAPLDKPFRLLDLPAELREHVYCFVLLEDGPLLLLLEPVAEKRKGRVEEGRMTVTDRVLVRIAGASSTRGNNAHEHAAMQRGQLHVALLCTYSLVHKEARHILYAENEFKVPLESGVSVLAKLNQRVRSRIRSVTVTIPTQPDLLDIDRFPDLVYRGLRYCWGLRRCTIVLKEALREQTANISLYVTTFGLPPVLIRPDSRASAFRALRWLPESCKVVAMGDACESVKEVTREEGLLKETLHDVAYLARQR